MNRKSLFGRFAAPITANRPAERPDYFRVHIEPLEDRKMLAAGTVWVNDNWANLTHPSGPLTANDTVVNTNDTTAPGGISGNYGTTAFGTVAGQGTLGVDGTHPFGYGFIRSAIDPQYVSNNGAGTVSILEGTYTESDIVVDTATTILGNGASGAAQTLIIPDIASAQGGAADAEFGVGTHSGFIMYNYSVSISNLRLDGSGNAALNGVAGHGQNYHQGITTLYELQNGGNYASEYKGGLPLKQLNIPGGPVGNRSVPALNIGGDIDNPDSLGVTVDNPYWHGLTISALAGQSFGSTGGSTGTRINISDSHVNNVGPTGSKDLNRIGILLQNIDNSPTDGNANDDVVNNSGVGIKLAAYGTNRTFGSSAAARNKGGFGRSTVNDAAQRGFDLQFWDSTEISSGSTVNNSNALNTSVGFYVNHGQMLMTGDTVNGAFIGLQVQNTSRIVDPATTSTPFPTFAANFVLNGPSSTRVGSVGVLAENSSAEPGPVSFGMSLNFNVFNYETGVKAGQPVATAGPHAGEVSLIIIDRLNEAGNKTGFNIGNNVDLQGSWIGNDPIVFTGNSTFNPGFTPFINYAYAVNNQQLPPTPPPTAQINPTTYPTIGITVADPPNSGSVTMGGLTLASTSHYAAQLTGTASSLQWESFNAPINWLDLSQYNSTQANPWRPGFTPTGTQGTWSGAVTQDGSGSILVDPATATELGFLYSNNPNSVFDVTGYDTLEIVAKDVAGAANDVFGIIVSDIDGTTFEYFFPRGSLNTSTYTTLTANINSPAVSGDDGDNVFTLSKITSWGIIGDGGYTNGILDPFGVQLDNMRFLKQNGNDQLVASSAAVGGVLDTTLGLAFVPAMSQSFTIIDNTGGSATSGTFYSLAQGGRTTAYDPTNLATHVKVQIDYSAGGGSNNNVTLTRVSTANVAPASDLNGATAGTNNSVSWSGTPIAISPAGTLTDADDTHLKSVTVAFSGSHDANDVLDATVTGTGITKSYNGTTLTLSGVATKAVYETVLHSVTYHNTSTPSTAGPYTLNVVANDFDTSSSTNTITVDVGAVVSSSVTGRFVFYDNSFFDDSFNDPTFNNDTAIDTHKTALLPGAGTSTYANYTTYDKGLNGIMVDLSHSASHSAITKSDFSFKTSGPGGFGASNNPGADWTTLATAPTVTVRMSGGPGGTDRIELTWPSGTIKDTWLQVTTNAGGNTGLAAADHFYFGSLPGDTNNVPPDDVDFRTVDVLDQSNIRAHSNIANSDLYYNSDLSTALGNLWDINRDDQVDVLDQSAARTGSAFPNNELDSISIPMGGPFAPPPPAAGAAVASALAGSGSGSSSSGGSWVANSLAAASSASGGSATASAICDMTDDGDDGDESDVDEEVLDSIIS